MMSTAFSILKKDLRMEFRSKESILAMWIFSLLIFVIFNFTFEVSRLVMLEIAPGLLWVAFVFSGMFGLNQSFSMEKENGNLRAMALMPVDGGQIYVGKFLSVTIIMLMFEALIFPIFIIFYDLQLSLGMFMLIPVLLAGTIGFTSLGTILSAVAVHTRNQQILLSLLLWPLVSPIIIWSVTLTGMVLSGEMTEACYPLLVRVGAFDVIFFTLSYMLFDFILED
ncbi:MAG: ABC transporter permease [Candidatus Marinimicrobia bacterium]|jgi:heme exporter protein B|nr:ABC transporter permease [Candidatus Neomarinimicrobiota bacterium]MBT3630362.1 ABC transporter permease [Candidatus Neomarinimicrobiota bacterium]MBT3823682.1 ABC transporter permease [Candidatus Neomarinimicrobiota bacterium]MBT4131970.1 ABC transporter permease [Candidatus Neomarinimicrobiota bacterium]MBT4294695.1 ABC transporter permease [Candidatus Neomarinimicrobiota bacterium]